MNKFIKKSLVLISTAALVVPAVSTASNADSSITRDISGSDRFSTAVSIAKSGWANGSENVMLVNSKAVADSLSVAPLASKLKAPVLLTGSSSLRPETKQEIQRLKSKRVIIIGGYSSVSKNIENNLLKEGYEVERISGTTRVETSLNIAKRLKDFSKGDLKTGFVVNGMNGLADAAGAGAIAAKEGSPIIFANKNKAGEIKSSVGSLGIGNVYLIGGFSSLPQPFETVAQNVMRISGKDRQETNLNLINQFYSNYSTVYVADDGSKNPSKLIDSVLINAGIIASNNKGEDTAYIAPGGQVTDKQESEIKDKNVSGSEKENTVEQNKDEKTVQNSEEKTVQSEDLNSSSSDKNVSENIKQDAKDQITSENIKKDAKEENAENDVKVENTSNESTLKEGPVMIVSEKNGFTYGQMKELNGTNQLSEIIQVSGGSGFKKAINNISDFIVNKDNKAVQNAFNKMMSYEFVNIEYNAGRRKSVLNGNNILQMMQCNAQNGFKVTFDRNKAKQFVAGIDVSNLGSGAGTAYAYRKNGKVVIDKNGFGVVVNRDKETDRLMEMLGSGKSYFNLVPSYSKKAAPKGAMNLGNKYVQIDLRSQHMWVWKDGKAIVSTPIVSGNPNRGMATPPGIFTIKKKMRNAVLRGPGYASPVKYWIPFNGSIGIHDAYWQPVYGGSRYLYAGSHGCINTPLKAVGVLYSNVSVGTPVIVQSDARAR